MTVLRFDGKINARNIASNTGQHKIKRNASPGSKAIIPFPSADSNYASRLVIRGCCYPNLGRRSLR